MSDFVFTPLPLGGYQVRDAEGGYLGEVTQGPYGWSSHIAGDDDRTPADGDTREVAAERLVQVHQLRVELAARGPEGAGIPDGYEPADAADLHRGDIVLTARRLTQTGKVGEWSLTGPRTVRESFVTSGFGFVEVSFEYDWTGGERHRKHLIAAGYWRQVARLVETPATRASAAAAATTRHLSPHLDDFDFLLLIAFTRQILLEGGARQAFEGRAWTFDTPELNAQAATLDGMLALLGEHEPEIAAWHARPRDDQIELMRYHFDDVRERHERQRSRP